MFGTTEIIILLVFLAILFAILIGSVLLIKLVFGKKTNQPMPPKNVNIVLG
jgi:hypothetical protein